MKHKMNEKSKITIRNSADSCLIEIDGIIGVPEEWQFENPSSRVATYEKFRDTVEKIAAIQASEIVVDIRSTGGDVNDALLIHDALKALDARITTRCFGYTASAATVIAQAASEGCRKISANALYLVHKSSCAVEGNADELASHAELLTKTDERLAQLYAARSGRDAAQFAALMSENGGEGRWLSPDETIAAGLADAIFGDAADADADTAQKEQPQPGQSEQQTSWMAGEGFLSRNWSRLKAALGKRSGESLPKASDDRNVLHFGAVQEQPSQQTAQVRSAIAFEEGQRQAAPTMVKPSEDPSLGDIRHTSNEAAYLSDARSFAR